MKMSSPRPNFPSSASGADCTGLLETADSVLSETLKRAIHAGDCAEISQLLCESVIDGFSQEEMRALLVEAIAWEKFEAFSCLRDIFLTYKNFRLLDPALVLALLMHRSDDFVTKLAEVCVDVNQRDSHLRTPLHLSLQRETLKVAELLVAKGANVDAKDCEGHTPLHCAVQNSNRHAVYMLLYYNARPDEVSVFTKATPFMMSLCSADQEIQEALIPYVTDFNRENIHGQNTLYLALKHRSPFVEEIVKGGGKIGTNITLLFTDVRIFCVMWPMITRKILAQQRFPLLKKIFGRCNIPKEELLHYLYSLLSWKHADYLIEQYANAPSDYKFSLFADIADTFLEYNFEVSDRLSVLYLLLSMGAPVYRNDLHRIYKCFGYKEEFEAVMIVNPEIRDDNLFHNASPFLEYVCFNRTNTLVQFHCDMESMLDLCHLLKFYVPGQKFQTEFFVSSAVYVNVYGQFPQDPYKRIVNTFRRKKISSLLQLSRDRVRDIVYLAGQTNHNLLNFYSVIQSLPVPKVIKDTLLLKKPLY